MKSKESIVLSAMTLWSKQVRSTAKNGHEHDAHVNHKSSSWHVDYVQVAYITDSFFE